MYLQIHNHSVMCTAQMYLYYIHTMDSLGVTEVGICTSIPNYWLHEKSNPLYLSV